MRTNAQNLTGAVLVAVALLVLAPAIISYVPYKPAWDDSFFMHRALALRQELRNADAGGVHDCLRDTFKSPMIAFLSLLPWNLLADPAAGPGLLHVSLAMMEWCFVALCFYIMWRCRASPLALLLASISVTAGPFVRSQAGTFLVDPLLSWVVLGTVLLVCMEARCPSGGSRRADFARGAFWGLFVCTGLLCKATYLFFGGLAMATVLFLHYRRHGRTCTLRAAGAMTLVCLPAILMWMSFGKTYLHHALASSWGAPAAEYAAESSSWIAFWSRYGTAIGWGALPLAIVAAMAVWRGRLARPSWPALVPAGILMAYVMVASASENALLRMLLPAMIGIPFALAILWQRKTEGCLPRLPVVLVFGVLLLACIPEMRRPQLDAVRSLGKLLITLKEDGCTRVVVATDSPNVLNVELVQLARVMLGKNSGDLQVSTVVYDDINRVSPDESLGKIRAADAVVFEQPLPDDPRFTNTRAAGFLQFAESTMEPFAADPWAGLLVYVSGKVSH